MSGVAAPPIYEPIVDKNGTVSLPWILFFNQIFTGDTGTEWTPAFTGLTSTGTPTLSGIYYKINQRLTYFRAVVTPATDTSAIAGTTFINNFPLTIRANGSCLATAGTAGSIGGSVVASSNRIYVPTWTLVTVPVTITGLIEAR